MYIFFIPFLPKLTATIFDKKGIFCKIFNKNAKKIKVDKKVRKNTLLYSYNRDYNKDKVQIVNSYFTFRNTSECSNKQYKN